VFRVYSELLSEHGVDLPALIPQVYLHYDPYTRLQRRAPGSLRRQRMDFLLLMRGRCRLVLECDGKHHYADDDGLASPRRYAEMVAADRELNLAGYEVVRFGGAEFQDAEQSLPMLRSYFTRLFTAHGYLPDSAA
jgi:very-short-patch-repair endonuclease